MKKTRIKFGYVFASVVLVLLIAAAVIRVKSYCNTGAVISSYTVASKEVVIRKENGETNMTIHFFTIMKK